MPNIDGSPTRGELRVADQKARDDAVTKARVERGNRARAELNSSDAAVRRGASREILGSHYYHEGKTGARMVGAIVTLPVAMALTGGASVACHGAQVAVAAYQAVGAAADIAEPAVQFVRERTPVNAAQLALGAVHAGLLTGIPLPAPAVDTIAHLGVATTHLARGEAEAAVQQAIAGMADAGDSTAGILASAMPQGVRGDEAPLTGLRDERTYGADTVAVAMGKIHSWEADNIRRWQQSLAVGDLFVVAAVSPFTKLGAAARGALDFALDSFHPLSGGTSPAARLQPRASTSGATGHSGSSASMASPSPALLGGRPDTSRHSLPLWSSSPARDARSSATPAGGRASIVSRPSESPHQSVGHPAPSASPDRPVHRISTRALPVAGIGARAAPPQSGATAFANGKWAQRLRGGDSAKGAAPK